MPERGGLASFWPVMLQLPGPQFALGSCVWDSSREQLGHRSTAP